MSGWKLRCSRCPQRNAMLLAAFSSLCYELLLNLNSKETPTSSCFLSPSQATHIFEDMPLLPYPTNDLICSYLPPQDILRYSRACKESHRLVQNYMTRAFCIYTVASRYFTQAEFDQFRILQALTGMLISGSTALQFFARVSYPESDLDVYVEHRYCGVIADFLLTIGYKFEPRAKQPNELKAAIRRTEQARHDYSGRGFAGVYNLRRNGCVIQLITTKLSPMHIILSFHSTVVINVISYSHAYCLYPKATFVKHCSLICFRDERPERDAARQKYVDRGWKMLDTDGIEWRAGYQRDPDDPLDWIRLEPSERARLESLDRARLEPFHLDSMRHVGDAYCWTIALPTIPNYPSSDGTPSESINWGQSHWFSRPTPLFLDEKNSGRRVVESNSWVLAYQCPFDNPWKRSQMTWNGLENPYLRFSYCVATENTLGKKLGSVVYGWKSIDEMRDFLMQKGMQRTDFETPTWDLNFRLTIEKHFEKAQEKRFMDRFKFVIPAVYLTLWLCLLFWAVSEI